MTSSSGRGGWGGVEVSENGEEAAEKPELQLDIDGIDVRCGP